MKKFFLSLSLVLSALPTFASAATTLDFDNMLVEGKKLAITQKFITGQYDQKIIENYKRWVLENNVFVLKRHEAGEDANHRALRRHADCSLKPTTCKSQAVR